jgi:hypothetical protein
MTDPDEDLDELERALDRVLPHRESDRERDEGFQLGDLGLEEPPEEADDRGLAFRGSERDSPGPKMPWDVNTKGEVWSDNAAELYEQAKRRQWDAAHDIPWEAGEGVDPELEEALATVLTWMIQQEYAAWYVPAKFLPRINPAYSEVQMFLSSQVVDEARHAEVFLKRLKLNGAGLQKAMPSTESSIKGLLKQDDYAQASFLLHVLGEGTFKDLFHLLIEVAPDEATKALMTHALEDEARHVAYGVHRLRGQLERAEEPDRVGEQFVDALDKRLSFTYEVSGIPSQVQEGLAVLAGGGTREEQVTKGEDRVQAFVEGLNANREERLRKAGFSERIVQDISDLHVRSAGGLM